MSPIGPPPTNVGSEPDLRGWFRRVPSALNVYVAWEIDWLESSDSRLRVTSLRETYGWLRGERTLADLARDRSPFALQSWGGRRTARRTVGLLTCMAHAERGSRAATADECVRLIHRSQVPYWEIWEVLHAFAEHLTGRIVSFAETVECAEDRAVLWDLLVEAGWRPHDDELVSQIERLDADPES